MASVSWEPFCQKSTWVRFAHVSIQNWNSPTTYFSCSSCRPWPIFLENTRQGLLAPTLELLKEIQEELANDPKRHILKKRKQDKTSKEQAVHKLTKQTRWTASNGDDIADAPRARIASISQFNKVLLSLLTTKKHTSEKDQKHNFLAMETEEWMMN